MDGQMTLAEVAEGIVQYTNEGLGVMIHRSDEMAATVRAAMELLERCDKAITRYAAFTPTSAHVVNNYEWELLADIRKLRGGDYGRAYDVGGN